MDIAIDFDGTIVAHQFPDVGPPVPQAIESIHELMKRGHRIILHTMRSAEHLEAAVGYMAGCNIKLFGVNENPEQKAWTDSPKAYAQLYIDDAAVGVPLVWPLGGKRPYVDWPRVMAEIDQRASLEAIRQREADYQEALL